MKTYRYSYYLLHRWRRWTITHLDITTDAAEETALALAQDAAARTHEDAVRSGRLEAVGPMVSFILLKEHT